MDQSIDLSIHPSIHTHMNRHFRMLDNGTLLHFEMFSLKVIAIYCSYCNYNEKRLTRQSANYVCSLH